MAGGPGGTAGGAGPAAERALHLLRCRAQGARRAVFPVGVPACIRCCRAHACMAVLALQRHLCIECLHVIVLAPQGGNGCSSTCQVWQHLLSPQGSEVMRVSDDVEMVAPGEPHSAVVRIQALWSERPQDGRERMLARTQRYYRCCCRCRFPRLILAALRPSCFSFAVNGCAATRTVGGAQTAGRKLTCTFFR